MALLGGIDAYHSLAYEEIECEPGRPLQNGGLYPHIALIDPDQEKGGWNFIGGGCGGEAVEGAMNAIDAGADKAWFYICCHPCDPIDDDDDGYSSLIYADHHTTSGTPRDGRVRVTCQVTSISLGPPWAINFRWQVEQYWFDQDYIDAYGGLRTGDEICWRIIDDSVNIHATTLTSQHEYLILGLDFANQKIGLWRNGSQDLTSEWVALPGGSPSLIADSDYSIEVKSYTSKSQLPHDIDIFESFVNDDSGSSYNTRMSFSNSSTVHHCFALIPVSDVAAGEWEAVGGSAICTDVYRVLDDYYDDYDRFDDYAAPKSGAGDKDQLFELSNIVHASATVAGVYICAGADYFDGPYYPCQKFLARCPSEGATIYAYVGSVDGQCRYVFLDETPGGNPWTRAKANELQVGLRSTYISSTRAYNLWAGVIGTYGARKTPNAGDCPWSMTVTAAGVASVTGALTVEGAGEDVWLAGTSAGVAALAGLLGLDLKMAGTIPGVGSASGLLSLTLPFAGSADGVSSLSGLLARDRPLVGSIGGQGGVVGVLTLNVGMAATSAAVATLIAALTVLEGFVPAITDDADISIKWEESVTLALSAVNDATISLGTASDLVVTLTPQQTGSASLQLANGATISIDAEDAATIALAAALSGTAALKTNEDGTISIRAVITDALALKLAEAGIISLKTADEGSV